MSVEIEHLDIALPDRLALKHFMHRRGFALGRPAIVQLRDGHLQTSGVIFPILHSVPPILPRSSGSFQSSLAWRECNGLFYEFCRSCNTQN